MKLNEAQIKYLRSLGLDAEAEEAETTEFVEGLNDDQRAFLKSLAQAPETPEPSETPPPADGPEAEGERETPPAAPTAEQVAETVRAAAKAERQRVAQIRSIAGTMGLGEEWIARQIGGDFTIDQVREAAISQAAANGRPIPIGAGSRAEVGADRGQVATAAAIMDAILIRGNHPLLETDELTGLPVAERPRKPHELAGRWRGKALFQMAEMFLQMAGRDTTGMSRPQIAQAAFIGGPRIQFRDQAGMLTTSDFPYLLASAQGKAMQARYVMYPAQWRAFCDVVTAPDFKTQKLIRLGDFPTLPEIKEAGEYGYVKLSEEQETWALAKRGHIFPLSWEAIVNDDLGAFGRLLVAQGRAAAMTDDVVAFAIVTGNPAMGDGNNLFDAANHSNLAQGGDIGAPSIATYNAMELAMLSQQGVGSNDYIMAIPAVILAAVALKGTVSTLNQSQDDPTASSDVRRAANIWRDRLNPVHHPLLDASSSTAWYVCTDPAVQPAAVLGRLEGYVGPQLAQETGFDADVRRYKVTHVVAAKATDWRLWYKNAGA